MLAAPVAPVAPEPASRKRPAPVAEPRVANSTPTAAAPMPAKIGEYDLEAKVGEGTYGSVYRAVDPRNPGTTVAIKRMKSVRDGISHTAYREIALVRELRNPHIVRMLDVILERDEAGARALNLVFEHVDGDLSQLIRAKRGTGFEPRVVRLLMRQLLDGLAYLHRCAVMHRDIKPANLLGARRDAPPARAPPTPRAAHPARRAPPARAARRPPAVRAAAVTADGRLKIGDFGLARLYDQPLRALHLDGPVVTVWYRAPELLLGAASHTPAVDCWAAGCIFGELFCCKALFTATEAKGDELQKEQLRSIFSALGMPREADWPGLPQLKHWPLVSQWASAGHADTLEQRIHAGCCPPAPKPAASALKLLRGLLCFAPERRLTADAALADGYLAEEPGSGPGSGAASPRGGGGEGEGQGPRA